MMKTGILISLVTIAVMIILYMVFTMVFHTDRVTTLLWLMFGYMIGRSTYEGRSESDHR